MGRIQRAGLFSRDRSVSSIALRVLHGGTRLGRVHVNTNGLLKGSELVIGQNHQERLQEDDGLSQAGVEVKMRGVYHAPIGRGLIRNSTTKVFSGLSKIFAAVSHQFLQGPNFVPELGALGEQDTTQKIAHPGSSLPLGALEIRRIKRPGVGKGSVMPGMLVQRAEKRGQ